MRKASGRRLVTKRFEPVVGTYNIFAQGEIPQCFYFGVGNYSIFNTVTQNFVSYVRTYLPPINFTVVRTVAPGHC